MKVTINSHKRSLTAKIMTRKITLHSFLFVATSKRVKNSKNLQLYFGDFLFEKSFNNILLIKIF